MVIYLRLALGVVLLCVTLWVMARLSWQVNGLIALAAAFAFAFYFDGDEPLRCAAARTTLASTRWLSAAIPGRCRCRRS
jgi:hypothetical protein